MDFFDVINSRRSVRRFLDQQVSEKDIKKIIEAGTKAPSACNVQGWRFIVINKKDVMKNIVEAGTAAFIIGSPVGILVVYDNRTDNLEYKDHMQSGAACVENMALAATSLGIGSCWVCHLPLKRQLRKILDIPSSFDPIAYLALGYAEKKTMEIKKKAADDLISYNKFRFKEERISLFRLFFKRAGRIIFYNLPFRKHLRKSVDKKFERKFD